MFQCIIQQRNGWIRNSPELKDVFPGKKETIMTGFEVLTAVSGKITGM
jgi:hypothetical protein